MCNLPEPDEVPDSNIDDAFTQLLDSVIAVVIMLLSSLLVSSAAVSLLFVSSVVFGSVAIMYLIVFDVLLAAKSKYSWSCMFSVAIVCFIASVVVFAITSDTISAVITFPVSAPVLACVGVSSGNLYIVPAVPTCKFFVFISSVSPYILELYSVFSASSVSF